MNRKKWVMPFVALILVCLIGTLLIYPIINMQPKDITIGVLSLDRGTELPQGKVNLGDKLTENITEVTENSDYSSVVTWKLYENEGKLRRDIKEGKIHGGIIVPEDFTETQTASIESFNKLNDGISKLADGMAQVDSGTGTFAAGVSALPSSLQKLSGGTSALNEGLQSLETAMGSKDTENTLIYASNAVAGGVSGIEAAITDKTAPAVKNLAGGLTSVNSIESQITADLEKAAQLLAEGDTEGAQQAIEAASQKSEKASEALSSLSDGAAALDSGMSAMADKMSSLSAGAAGLTEGLVNAKSGISALKTGAGQLDAGVSAFSEKSSDLVSGAAALSNATGQLNTGITTLSDSVSSMVDGIAEQLTGENAGDTVADADTASDEDSETSLIKLVINQGSNVTVSSVLESMLTKVFAQAGLEFESEYINPVSAGFSATYFGTCVFIFIYLVSYATGVILTRNQPLGTVPARKKIRPALIQLGYAAVLAASAGGIITLIISLISDMQMPIADTFIFLSLAAFALIMVVAGAIDLFGMAGMAIPIMMLVLGIGTANMPYEFLPAVWQKWIYPWMPLQIISNGIKRVVYTGAGWWNDLTGDLLIVVAVGMALLLIATLKPAKEKSCA